MGCSTKGRGEQGQALPLVVLMVVFAAVACVGVVRVGSGAIGRARSATAADAAALAAAAGADAADIAQENGASIVAVERLAGGDVRVAIERDGIRASARARPGLVDGAADAGGSGAGRAGLAPAMLASLQRADELLGDAVPVTSGYRSTGAQHDLWARRATIRWPVARPGSSMHERGLAVDVPLAWAERLASVAKAAGLCRPLPAQDPIHFELCGARFTEGEEG